MLILCGDLVRAVRLESETAICHWFGVGITTVWKWRKALGVKSINEGTSALLSRWAPETIQGEKATERLAGAQGSPGVHSQKGVRAQARVRNSGRADRRAQRLPVFPIVSEPDAFPRPMIFFRQLGTRLF